MVEVPIGVLGPGLGPLLNSLDPSFPPNPYVATSKGSAELSTPNPGDVLPLWNPDIPGEEIQAGRLGIRVRPGTPAAAKVSAFEAAGGAELLRQVLEEQRLIDGIYTIIKPEKPIDFVGQVKQTLRT